MKLSMRRLARQVANDNGSATAPEAAPSLWRERVRRVTDKAGEWFADAFIIGGVIVLLTLMGWL